MPTRYQAHTVLTLFPGTAAVGTVPRPTDGCGAWVRDWATSPIPGFRPEVDVAA